MTPELPPWEESPPEETLDELYESAPCGYLTLSTANMIVRANGTLLRWLGVSRETLIGTRVQSIFTPAGRIFFETHVGPLLSLTGSVGQVAVDLRRSDGGRLPVLSDWRPVVINGRPVGVRAMLVDATDRRAYERDLIVARERAQETADQLAERETRLRELNQDLEQRVVERTAALELVHEQLRQSQKLEAMGSLVGGVAHDFNNLLSPIIASLDYFERRQLGDARVQRSVGNALEAAERAKTLVQRLLAFARRQPLTPVPVDLAAIVREMEALLRSTLGARIAVELVLESTPPVLADANQIEMALLNLILNAKDALPNGGQVRVRTALTGGEQEIVRSGNTVELSVEDDGSGMDAETLSRAIEPFYSTKEVGKGTGLGLSMVHGLAGQLGGELEIISAPGAGTLIRLRLPVADQ